jgi:hypothetical protein
MKNKNVPAFPCPTENRFIESNYLSEEIIGYGGMDLRDYFASKAMQGLLMAQKKYDDVDGYYQNSLSLAIHSYLIADTMMKAREK